MLATQINSRLENHEFPNFSVVRVDKYVCNKQGGQSGQEKYVGVFFFPCRGSFQRKFTNAFVFFSQFIPLMKFDKKSFFSFTFSSWGGGVERIGK